MRRWIRAQLGPVRLVHRVMNAGFTKVGEPCPGCGHTALYFERGVETYCARCQHGRLWPDTCTEIGVGI